MAETAEEIEYTSSPAPTVGVELEIQLLDADTFALAPVAHQLLASVAPDYSERITKEFLQSMVEIRTRVCRDIAEVESCLEGSIDYLDRLLEPLGALSFQASLHPFSLSRDQLIVDDPRYRRIFAELQYIGRRFISQGLHVHIGIADAETAVRVMNSLRTHLPVLLALSTSSPFFEGENTGLFSYRSKLFEALPRAGMPVTITDWEEFQRVVALLKRAGVIEGVKDIYWDVRIHPDFGTVETRIFDMPCRLGETLGLIALTQALVVRLSEEDGPVNPTLVQIHRSNKWQATRYGLDGFFADAVTGDRKPMREAAEDLIESVRETARSLGSEEYLRPLERVLTEGTGAYRQLELYDHEPDFRKMIETLRREFRA